MQMICYSYNSESIICSSLSLLQLLPHAARFVAIFAQYFVNSLRLLY
jgi:phosphatidylserine/phosphatidylglycerophosphate/cardiolipin synthase-like enzyme